MTRARAHKPQNSLVCLEMFIIAIAHRKWFNYLPYKVPELKQLMPNGVAFTRRPTDSKYSSCVCFCWRSD